VKKGVHMQMYKKRRTIFGSKKALQKRGSPVEFWRMKRSLAGQQDEGNFLNRPKQLALLWGLDRPAVSHRRRAGKQAELYGAGSSVQAKTAEQP
jgi:hypothetical protein